jgi:hypothetical protein
VLDDSIKRQLKEIDKQFERECFKERERLIEEIEIERDCERS